MWLRWENRRERSLNEGKSAQSVADWKHGFRELSVTELVGQPTRGWQMVRGWMKRLSTWTIYMEGASENQIHAQLLCSSKRAQALGYFGTSGSKFVLGSLSAVARHRLISHTLTERHKT